MKKTIYHIARFASVAFATLFLLSSCALTMEDWVQTEENKGYGETQKDEYDGMTVEYKYKDDTRSLTDKILDYYISLDSDSVMHFMETLPNEYLPTVGGCIVSNCCPTFPTGLIVRVKSIEHSNGMYNIAVTDADIKDAYDEFNYELDTDVLLASDTTSSQVAECKSRRLVVNGKEETVNQITDFTLYNRMINGKNQKTRATSSDYDEDIEDEDATEGDVNFNRIETVSETLYEVNNFTGQQSPLFNILTQYFAKSLLNDFYLKVSALTKTHIKKQVSLKDEREYQKTTSAYGYSIKFSIGFDAANIGGKKSAEKLSVARDTWRYFLQNNKNAISAIYDLAEKGTPAESKLGWAIDIPIPGIPVPLVLKITPNLNYSFGLYGGDSIAIWNSSSIVETEMVKGKQVKYEKRLGKTKPSNYMGFFAGGKFLFGGSLELFFGVGKRTGVRDVVGVGAFVSLGGNIRGTLDHQFIDDGIGVATVTNGISIGPSVEIGAKAYAGSYVDFTFGSIKPELPSLSFNYHPTLSLGEDDIVIRHYKDEQGKTYRSCKFSYTVSSSGSSSFSTYKPILMVYKKDVFKGNPVAIIYANENKNIKKGQKFTFDYSTYDTTTDYDLVPALKEPDVDGDDLKYFTIYPDYKRFMSRNLGVKIDYTPLNQVSSTTLFWGKNMYQHVYQTMGTAGWGGSTKGTEYEYKFVVPFQLSNAGLIGDAWSDWGIYYAIRQNNDDGSISSIGSKYVSLKDKITKSGSYQPQLHFKYTCSGFTPKISVISNLYYVPVGGGEKIMLVGSSAASYMTTLVTYDELAGFTLLRKENEMNNHFNTSNIPSWFNKKKVISLKSTSY